MFDIEDYIKQFTLIPQAPERKLWASEYLSNIVHSQGVYPSKKIGVRRPYEPDEIHKFREANYEPITKDAYSRAINDLQRILSRGGVSIDIPMELRTYMDEPRFEKTNFWHFMSHRVIRRMIEDPNGLLAWFPDRRPNDETEKAIVSPYLVFSTQIYHNEEDFVAWLSEEKSPVLVGNRTEKSGEVYYILTKEQAWKRIQVGRRADKKFVWELVYNHNLKFIPAFVLGGEPTTKREDNKEYSINESYFAGARAFLNEAIAQYSDHQGTMISASFPIREVQGMPCPDKCVDGWKYPEEGSENMSRHRCGTCGGRGQIAPTGPYGILLKPKPDNPGDITSDAPVMRFISPDTAILEYAGKHWDSLLQRGEKALNLLFVQEAQSGIAKEIDREGKQSTLDRIAVNVWEVHFKMSAKAIWSFIQPNQELQMSVALPNTFVVRSEEQLLNELKTLREAKAPAFLVSEVIKEIVRKRYPGDTVMQKRLELLIAWDPLFGYTKEEIDGLLATGGITDMDHARTVYGYSVTSYIYQQDPKAFEENDLATIVEEAEARLEEIAPVNTQRNRDGSPV